MEHFVCKDKEKPHKDVGLEQIDLIGVLSFGQVGGYASAVEFVGRFGCGDKPVVGFVDVGAACHSGTVIEQ